jgi:hypothetical protein
VVLTTLPGRDLNRLTDLEYQVTHAGVGGHAKLETTQIYTDMSIRLLKNVHAHTPTACRGQSWLDEPASLP